MPRPRPYTDDQLRDAVAASTNLRQVHLALGLVPGGYRIVLAHMQRLGLDVSHMDLAPRPRRRREWTDEDLKAVVARVFTLSDVLRELGYQPNGGMHRYMRQRIANLGLDTTHFTGQAWNRGRRQPGRGRPLDEILVANSTYTSSAGLRKRLVASKIKEERCEGCGLTEWQGRPIPLQLDHISGDHTDNRLENLRILCGNCHSQTDTWCARGRKS